MKHPLEHPTRLVDLSREQDLDQVRLLIRSATEAPSEHTPAAQWRIRNTLHQRRQRQARLLRFALVSAFMFLAGGVAGAVAQPLLRARLLGLIFSHAAPHADVPARHDAHRRSLPQPHVTEKAGTQVATVPFEEKAPAETATAPNASARAPSTPIPPGTTQKDQTTPRRVAASHIAAPSVRQPSAEPPPALPSQPLGLISVPGPEDPTIPASAASSVEQTLIATALQRLRVSNEPAAALAALDENRRRFPHGELSPEADRLRAEALLRLGRKATLRDELDRSLPDETSGSDERVLLRGELRAASGRWQAALADFDAVVRAHSLGASNDTLASDHRTRERMERALWGRASARSHLGNDVGARADLHDYLRRFPDGRFAAQASHLLDERR